MDKISSRPYVVVLALYALFEISVLAYAKYGVGATYGSKEFIHAIFVPHAIMAVVLIAYCYFSRDSYQLPNPSQPLGWKLILISLVPTVVVGGYVITSQASATKAFIVPFMAMLAVGISEELTFRKIVMTSLLKDISPARTILVSAVIFSALHAFNLIAGQTLKSTFTQLLMTFLAGLVYGVFYMYTKNITVMIFLHWWWDYILISGAIKPESPWSMLVSAMPLIELIAMGIILYKYKELRTTGYLAK